MKIVITENEDFNPEVIQELKKIAEVYTYNSTTEKELVEAITDADVIFVRLRFKLTKAILKQASNLKYILTATTGLDHIDVDYFESVGGKIISLRGETQFLNSIPSTAEHTWALLLSLVRKLPNAFQDVKMGNWNRDIFKGNNLANKKIAILGLGRVGIQVANYAKAFNMQVGFYDVVDKNEDGLQKFKSAEELFQWADIISIHIPLNKQTNHFIDKELLDLVNPKVIIINTSRGAVVNENYLAQKLEQKLIKGYATDVLENELDINIDTNKVVNLASKGYNIIITPHIAGATYESMHSTENFILQKFTNSF